MDRVNPRKPSMKLDIWTDDFYNHLQMATVACLEVTHVGSLDEYKGTEETVIWTRTSRSNNWVAQKGPNDEPQREPYDYPVCYDINNILILGNSRPTFHSISRMFISVLAVELQYKEIGSANDQARQLQRTHSFGLRADRRYVLRTGYSPRDLPYEIARRTGLMAIRHPDHPTVITTTWGLTTIANNMGLYGVDYSQNKHSYHHFANAHPEKVLGHTFRYASEPRNVRRPIDRIDLFGPHDRNCNLDIEDYPTYGKSSNQLLEFHSHNIFDSPIFPRRHFWKSLVPLNMHVQPSIPIHNNDQLHACMATSSRFNIPSIDNIHVQPSIPKNANTQLYACMASRTRSSTSQINNTKKIRVRTILESAIDDLEDSDSSNEMPEYVSTIVNLVPELTQSTPQSNLSTPLSQASTQTGSYTTASDVATQPTSNLAEVSNKPEGPRPQTDPSLLEFEDDPQNISFAQKEIPMTQERQNWSKEDILHVLNNAEDYDTSTIQKDIKTQPEQVSQPEQLSHSDRKMTPSEKATVQYLRYISQNPEPPLSNDPIPIRTYNCPSEVSS